jgi:hypothetical protein
MVPAMMANIPAVVGFQVFSISVSPFYLLYNDIVRNPHCQYPKTSITAKTTRLPAITHPDASITAL